MVVVVGISSAEGMGESMTSADLRRLASGAMMRMARPRLSRVFPGDVTSFKGPAWTAGMLAVVNAAGRVRSLIHIIAPDSGAQSIASMDTQVKGGGNIVALLAQWGGPSCSNPALSGSCCAVTGDWSR
jgi:hypothetical protein